MPTTNFDVDDAARMVQNDLKRLDIFSLYGALACSNFETRVASILRQTSRIKAQ